jgi:hypothetical protein
MVQQSKNGYENENPSKHVIFQHKKHTDLSLANMEVIKYAILWDVVPCEPS